MSSTTALTSEGPRLSEHDRAGLRDFWAVYERHHEEIAEGLMAELRSVPEIEPMLVGISEAERAERSSVSHELMRRAVLEDDWAPYLASLRAQGEMYAEMGLSFQTWFQIVGAFRPYMRAHLVTAYGEDPDRLVGALSGMTALLDLVMARVGETYLDAQRRIIAEQEETVRDLSTSRAVLASVADGIITTDPDGRITSVNPAMERMVGWSREEILGHLYSEVYPMLDGRGDPIPVERRSLSRAIASRRVVADRGFDLTMVTRDGRRLPVGITAAPIVDEEGDLLGGVDVLRDTSHEREIDRMKSSLVSTVSHELRTPLTMIRGFAELLLDRDLPPEKARTAQEQIRDASDRLSRLIDDLLSVSKIDSGKMELHLEPLDLPATVRTALEPFGEQRAVHLDVPASPPPVLADRDKVVQIVTNLVSNAVKYSPPETPVTVRIEANGSEVRTSVIDRGIGISEDDRERLFGKFFRVDRREVSDTKGTGLGLYITKNLVEIQGGEIRVDSEQGAGTTFAFTLPTEEAREDR